MRRRAVITPLGYVCAGMLILWMLTGTKSDKRENKTIKSAKVAAATSSPIPTPTTITFQEHHYTCGARTKKGSPCKRRVKSDDLRCSQHQGMNRIKN